MKKISIITGTNRPKSLTKEVVNQVEEIFKKNEIDYYLIDIATLPPESFTQQIFINKNDVLLKQIEKIKKSQGLYIVTPEYNGSMPGSLKQFIDSWSFPDCWDGKKVAFVGLASGEWGGLRPVEHLQGIFSYRDTFIYSRKVYIKKINQIMQENKGRLSSEIIDRLEKQIIGFSQFLN